MQDSPQQASDTAPDIPGYRLLEKLSSGNDADLYLAQQDTFNRQVALKIAASEDASNSAYSQELVQEAQIAAHLNHQHIIRVFDLGQNNDGRRYLAMEYLAAGDLKRRLQYDMTVERALLVVKHLASALDYVHRQGYVHSNLCPEHILLDDYDNAILSNFSHARVIGEEQPARSGAVMRSGAPQYISPEQIRGRTLDGRADFYRLGVILYEMLMGAPPFDHPDMTSLSMMILNAPPPRVAEPLAPLQPLIDGLLSKDISARYASGRELTADIEKLQGTVAKQQVHRKHPLPARPGHKPANLTQALSPSTIASDNDGRHFPAARPRRRARRRIAALVMGGTILLGGMYYLFNNGHLQRWAALGATSPNPQTRILSQHLQTLLAGTSRAG